MFTGQILGGRELKEALRQLRSLKPGESFLPFKELAKVYLQKRVAFEIERTLRQPRGSFTQTRLVHADLAEFSYSATLTAPGYEISATVDPKSTEWVCKIQYTPSVEGTTIYSGNSGLLGDALYTSPFKEVSGKRYHLFYDAKMTQPFLWTSGSHATTNSLKTALKFKKTYQTRKKKVLFIWDSKRAKLL